MRSKASASTDLLTEQTLRGLLAAGRSVVSELDLELVLERVLATAADVTGARYAALGILDERRTGLERFITHGLSAPVPGAPPAGHGVLGALIADPRPLRIKSLADDARSAGFPAGHPHMTTFLGVPVVIRRQTWGNLYLCDKEDGAPFTVADEEAVVVLAEWAAIAIENARLYQASERRVCRLEATTAIARALGGETQLDRVLELIAERGRALIGAGGLMILLREAGGLAIAACSGDVPAQARATPVTGVDGELLVPLVFRGESLGLLAAFGMSREREDEQLLKGVAASAATAVATARTVEEQRLRDAMRAAEQERRYWARELHDDTLQGLGGLRLLLNAAARSDDPWALLTTAVERVENEIDALRGLIRELRPAALDELGLAAAIEGLAERTGARAQLDVTTDVRLAAARYDPELETALYRIVQEAVNNAVRHADARTLTIAVTEADRHVMVVVRDDGHGFDPNTRHDGFGLTGMRERVALLQG